jgi:hypothetical protein
MVGGVAFGCIALGALEVWAMMHGEKSIEVRRIAKETRRFMGALSRRQVYSNV